MRKLGKQQEPTHDERPNPRRQNDRQTHRTTKKKKKDNQTRPLQHPDHPMQCYQPTLHMQLQFETVKMEGKEKKKK